MYTIYNIRYMSKVDFFKSLGYKNAIPQTQITNQYHGIDNLIKTRLNLTDESEIKNKLQELRDQFYSVKKGDINTSINMPALSAVYKSAFRMLNKEQQQAIICTVASLKSVAVETLTAEIEEDLKKL